MGKNSKKPIPSLLKALINTYAFAVSPWLGNRCRFAPSCSEYANQALEQHGVLKGGWLACRRICRCHPWGGQGYDPVPTNNPVEPTTQGLNINQHRKIFTKR